MSTIKYNASNVTIDDSKVITASGGKTNIYASSFSYNGKTFSMPDDIVNNLTTINNFVPLSATQGNIQHKVIFTHLLAQAPPH